MAATHSQNSKQQQLNTSLTHGYEQPTVYKVQTLRWQCLHQASALLWLKHHRYHTAGPLDPLHLDPETAHKEQRLMFCAAWQSAGWDGMAEVAETRKRPCPLAACPCCCQRLLGLSTQQAGCEQQDCRRSAVELLKKDLLRS